MACTRPLDAWHRPGGGITFTRSEGWGDRPLQIECSQCKHCRIARQQGWAIRCAHEAQLHTHKSGEFQGAPNNSFITLTYDDDHLPPNASLEYEHWQLFAKRCRKRFKMRYLHCGEYGDEKHRPHYHAILFGQDFAETRVPVTKRGEHLVYASSLLADLWPYGKHEIGSMTLDSAQYVARYTLKKLTGEKGREHYGVRQPEYATMSNRPGIGKRWLEKYLTDVYPEDQVHLNGRTFRPPRYYDHLLETWDPELHTEVMKNRNVFRLKHQQSMGYTEYEYNKVREIILASNTALTNRIHALD